MALGPGLLRRLWQEAPEPPAPGEPARRVLLLALNAGPAEAAGLLELVLGAGGGAPERARPRPAARGYSVLCGALPGPAGEALVELHAVSSPAELAAALPGICARFRAGYFSFLAAAGFLRLSELRDDAENLVALLQALRRGPLPPCPAAAEANAQFCTEFARAAARQQTDIQAAAPGAPPGGFPLSIFLRYSPAALARRRVALGGSLARALLGLRVIAAHFGAGLFPCAGAPGEYGGRGQPGAARGRLEGASEARRSLNLIGLADEAGPGVALLLGVLFRHPGRVGLNEVVNALLTKTRFYVGRDSPGGPGAPGWGAGGEGGEHRDGHPGGAPSPGQSGEEALRDAYSGMLSVFLPAGVDTAVSLNELIAGSGTNLEPIDGDAFFSEDFDPCPYLDLVLEAAQDLQPPAPAPAPPDPLRALERALAAQDALEDALRRARARTARAAPSPSPRGRLALEIGSLAGNRHPGASPLSVAVPGSPAAEGTPLAPGFKTVPLSATRTSLGSTGGSGVFPSPRLGPSGRAQRGPGLPLTSENLSRLPGEPRPAPADAGPSEPGRPAGTAERKPPAGRTAGTAGRPERPGPPRPGPRDPERPESRSSARGQPHTPRTMGSGTGSSVHSGNPTLSAVDRLFKRGVRPAEAPSGPAGGRGAGSREAPSRVSSREGSRDGSREGSRTSSAQPVAKSERAARAERPGRPGAPEGPRQSNLRTGSQAASPDGALASDGGRQRGDFELSNA